MSIKNEKIAVIGTGVYGISIGKRLLHFGYEVVFGSRKPNIDYIKESLNAGNKSDFKFSVTTSLDAWKKSDNIVILAISAEDLIYQNFVDEIIKNLSSLQSNSTKKSKTIVDISNLVDSVDLNKLKSSNAEKLNSLFKAKITEYKLQNYNINVVKGFNLINSYSISSIIDDFDKSSLCDDLIIPVASDDETSKQKVIDLCQKIGLRAYDVGRLDASLKLEVSNKQTFENWKIPSLISFLFFVFNFIWIFIIYFLFPKKPLTFQQYLDDFSLLSHLNKVLGFTALNLLAFVYFAYIVASVYQLKYSTKYKKFPKYLDYWLKTRKQFGLWAFLIASFHAIASMYVTNPLYLKDWFIKLNNNGVGRMTLNGELNIITGIIAYLLMVIVALTSINSIANSLNWSEWRFVQSKLGLTCLFMGVLHDTFMYIRIYNERFEYNYDFIYLITRVKLTALYFPILVLVLRFIITYFGPFNDRLEKIRNGTIVANQKKID